MKKQNGITLIALVISIIVMLILAGVSINAVIGDNGVIGKAQDTLYLQSCAVLEEFLQMEASNYALEENPYETQYGLVRAKQPGWFYQNAQGYILDSDGHVLYLIRKSGLPEEIQDQITGGDASKVSQYYKQVDVYGVTSDLQVYYCNNGTDTILGLTTEDLDKDNPLEIAYDEDSLLSKVVNGTNEEGKANEALSTQDLKSIKTLTIDTTEKLALLNEFIKLPTLQTVYFSGITIPNLTGIQNAPSITEVRFTSCTVSDYSALCELTKLNKLYLITPTGKNTDVATLCSSDKGIATAEFSNLKYFGIVGNSQYIQSTSQNYSDARYDITDVSGLANLSTTTKEAIQYMYLQNLQLTSIASLADYKNITILRLEENALTTFEGIQNMSKLSYLIAPTLYSNTTKSYTLGNTETDTQNTSTDALSYIYKDAEGKNTNLYYVDLRNAKNLKWTSYLSSCSNIRYLYMDSNTSIKDVTTIASTIGTCGVNASVPSQYTVSIISNDAIKLDLSNQTILKSDFEKIYKKDEDGNIVNNTALKYLSLYKIKIMNNNVEITGSEFNELVNEVLSTCTNLSYVQLAYLTDLSTIEFVKYTPDIRELDLRYTSVVTGTVDENEDNTGLELLNDLIKYDSDGKVTHCLGQLSVTNDLIDFTKIQPTISNLNGTTYWFESGWIGGLWCNSWTALKTLENCKNITKLYFNWHNAQAFYDRSKTLDLSNCTSLISFSSTTYRIGIIFPSSLLSLKMIYNAYTLPDVSLCNKLETIDFVLDWGGGMSQAEYDKFFPKLLNCVSLKTLNLYRCSIEDFTELGKVLPKMTALETLYVGAAGPASKYPEFNACYDYSPLGNAKSLENLYITYQDGITDISFISDLTNLKTVSASNISIKSIPDLSNLTNLTSLSLNSNKIVDISGIAGATNITSLNLSNNNINDIKPLQNLTQLETLNLSNNALYDNSYDSTGKSYYTLTVFSDLNQKQDGSLKNLYLSGNSIDDFSMLQDSNLKWDAKSGW